MTATVRAAANALAQRSGGGPTDELTFCPHCSALHAVTVRQRFSVESASTLCKVCERYRRMLVMTVGVRRQRLELVG